MNDYKPIIFNTNVFKDVVIQMTPDDLKIEEDKIRDLSKFITETGFATLIRGFSKNENQPTDSASLRDTFHQSGLNIRYLGKVAEEIKDKNLTHMKFMLEREVIIRCLKHLINNYIKNCPSDDLLGDVVSHLLNIFFAPRDFIKRLDDGQIKLQRNTLKQLAEETLVKNINQKIEILQGTAKLNTENRDETPSKKKKDKKKNKEQAAVRDGAYGTEPQADDGVKDINDLLFKQQNQSGEPFVFDSAELFKEPEVALSIHDSPEYDVLNLTPKQLYNEIKSLATKRYQYNLLPKKMHQLKILETHENKFSVLRDICMAVGIQINFRGNGTDDK